MSVTVIEASQLQSLTEELSGSLLETGKLLQDVIAKGNLKNMTQGKHSLVAAREHVDAAIYKANRYLLNRYHFEFSFPLELL